MNGKKMAGIVMAIILVAVIGVVIAIMMFYDSYKPKTEQENRDATVPAYQIPVEPKNNEK